MSKSNKES
jgi:hypothetical protein